MNGEIYHNTKKPDSPEAGAEKLKLICVPYAGSASSLFKGWDQHLGPDVEVIPFDYPGRGKRVREAASRSLDELIAEVLQLVGKIETPYAFFGHSMGAMVVYLAAGKISSLGWQGPRHVFFSGFEPPHLYFGKANQVHRLDDKRFIEALQEMESLPEKLLHSPRVLNMYLPGIRHDFYLLETYNFCVDRLSLDCKFSVFLGTHDPVTAHVERKEWESYSSRECRMYGFDGNPFFVESNAAEVTATIRAILRSNDLIRR